MNNNDFTLAVYQTEEGEIKLREDLNSETVWANLDQISTMFGRDKSTISRHIKKIFVEEELIKDEVSQKMAIEAEDGKTYQVEHFNLDLLISVGYRVNGKVATSFRKWATKKLKEYIIKGYTLNEERLKENDEAFGEEVEGLQILSYGQKTGK